MKVFSLDQQPLLRISEIFISCCCLALLIEASLQLSAWRMKTLIPTFDSSPFVQLERVSEARGLLMRLSRGGYRGSHCCQCNTPKWLTLISRVEFSFLKILWTRFSNLTKSRCGWHCSKQDADIGWRIQFFLSCF